MAKKIAWVGIFFGLAWAMPGPAKPKYPPPAILFLVAEGYNCDEFWPPWLVFRAAGFRVVLASPEGGPVRAGHSDRNLDVANSERLDTLTLTRFSGLYLVGGHSPENLERYPAALAGCRHFFETQKPVAAICHGPRLLEKAGLLKDKAGTLYFGIKDEVPERWVTSGFGLRYDRPWVVDENLLTSRYPLDVEPFVVQCLRHFSPGSKYFGGQTKRRIWVWNVGLNGRDRYFFRSAVFSPLGFDLVSVGRGTPFDPKPGDRVVIPHPETVPDSLMGVLEKLKIQGIPVSYFPHSHRADFSRFEKLPLPVENGLVNAFQTWNSDRGGRVQARPQSGKDTLWILLDQGFDEETVLGLQTLGRIHQREVCLVGEKKSVYTGLNGLGLKADHTFSERKPRKGEIWVAPGCLWPDSMASKARIQWIRSQISEGTPIWIGGYDVLSVFRHSAYSGWKVAGPDPARWEFQKTAEFVEDTVFSTRPHVLTFKGPTALPVLNLRLGNPIGH